MRRRDVINGIAGLLTAWPIAARGQPVALPVVGFLGPGSAESDAYRVTAFKQGLKEAGFVDGQNIKIEYRWAQNNYVAPTKSGDRLGPRASCSDRHIRHSGGARGEGGH